MTTHPLALSRFMSGARNQPHQFSRYRRVAFALVLAMIVSIVNLGLVPKTDAPAQADTATVEEFPIPGDMSAENIALGPDNRIWFSFTNDGGINRLEPSGDITHFDVPTGVGPLVTGSDHRLWFVTDDHQMGAITTEGVVTLYDVRRWGPRTDVALGPDGNVWFVGGGFGSIAGTFIGRITPTGDVQSLDLQAAEPILEPFAVTAGPDGNVWFTARTYADATPVGRFARVGRISPTFQNLTIFAPPSPAGMPGQLIARPLPAITSGSDGNIWYTDLANNIGRITPAGVITEFPLKSTQAFPSDIAAGPDGALWFPESALDRIGRITPSGVINEIFLPYPHNVDHLAAGADGRMYFQNNINTISRIDPASVVPPPPPCLVVTKSVTLKHDLGPCNGDGIAVRADNVTVNLGKYRIFATPPGDRKGEFAGVRLDGVHNVRVTGGDVAGFEAGVLLEHGATGNTVTQMNIHDNIGPANGGGDLGDGIALLHASGNRITSNTVRHNGPFDGIGVLGIGSDGNLIQANTVIDNFGQLRGGGLGIVVNPFLELEDTRRGESLHRNDIISNVVRNSDASGISSVSNVGALIRGNLSEHNGYAGDPSDGIGLTRGQQAQENTDSVVEGNTAINNFQYGIELRTGGNTVTRNTTSGNQGLDLIDRYADDCSTNAWTKNAWGPYLGTSLGSYFPECVSTSGRGPTPSVYSNQAVAQTSAAVQGDVGSGTDDQALRRHYRQS